MTGWIDNASQIEVRLAQARSGCLASRFIFVERPYCDHTSAPEVITVVDIRSIDGQLRMVQEFAGHIDDHALLDELIKRRIGPGWTGWKPVEVHFMKCDGDNRIFSREPGQLKNTEEIIGVDSREAQEDYLREGTLHLIYAQHATDFDFQLIEADLNKVVKDSKRLAMVLEDVSRSITFANASIRACEIFRLRCSSIVPSSLQKGRSWLRRIPSLLVK